MLRIAAIVGHHYMFDVLLGLREACEDVRKDLLVTGACEMFTYGWLLAQKYRTTQQLCNELGDVCQQVPEIDSIMSKVVEYGSSNSLFTVAYADNSAGAAISWADLCKRLASAVSSEQFLARADFVICGYPAVLCFASSVVPRWQRVPIVMAINGLLGEYVDDGLRRVMFEKFMGSWLTGDAQRYVFANTEFDLAVYRRVFQASAATLRKVPFCARYVHASVAAARTAREQDDSAHAFGVTVPRIVLLDNLNAILSQADENMFRRLLSDEAARVGLETHGWRFGDIRKPYEYVDRLRFNAVVMIPWDWGLITFQEWCSMSIPLFLPSASYMQMLIALTIKSVPDRFIRVMPQHWEGLPPGARNPWSFANATALVDRVAWWYVQTDFHQTLDIQHFDGAPDMVSQLLVFDADEVAGRMRQAHIRDVRRSSIYYRGLIEHLL